MSYHRKLTAVSYLWPSPPTGRRGPPRHSEPAHGVGARLRWPAAPGPGGRGWPARGGPDTCQHWKATGQQAQATHQHPQISHQRSQAKRLHSRQPGSTHRQPVSSRGNQACFVRFGARVRYRHFCWHASGLGAYHGREAAGRAVPAIAAQLITNTGGGPDGGTGRTHDAGIPPARTREGGRQG